MDLTFWFFTIVFFATFIYHAYKKYGGTLAMKGVKYMISKSTQEHISIAHRMANGTLRIKYKFNGKDYETILPLVKRSKKWNKVEAVMSDGKIKDVTNLAIKYGGPRKDFFKFSLKPGQLVRGSKSIRFLNKNNKIIMEFPIKRNIIKDVAKVTAIKEKKEELVFGSKKNALDEFGEIEVELEEIGEEELEKEVKEEKEAKEILDICYV